MRNLMIFLVLVLFVTALYSESDIVSADVIEEIALKNAKALWGNVTTGRVIPYYYSDEEIVAYRFNFYKGEQFPDEPDITTNEGFCTMLMGARKDMPVVLERSETLSHEYLLGNRLQEMAEQEVGKGYILERSYYLSISNVWYCVSNGSERKYIRVLPPQKVLGEQDFFEFTSGLDFFLKRDDFSEEWSSYESGERDLTRSDVLLVNHEYMPFYSWYDGCSPTSASMLLAWYDYNSINTYENYSNLVDWHYKDGNDYHNPNTNYQLVDAMDTNSSGDTGREDIVPGILEVANGYHDYEFSGSYIEDHNTTWYFNEIKDWVDDGLPLFTSIDVVGNHSVISIGYNEVSNEIGVHDPNVGAIDWVHKSYIEGVHRIWADGGYGNAFNLQYPHGDLRRVPWGAGDSGEVYEGNEICEIHWLTDMANPSDGSVTIILNKDSKYTDLMIIAEDLPNTGYYWWQVPNNIDSDSCMVWIELYDNSGDLIGADGSYGDIEIHPGGSFEELTYDNRVTTSSDPDFFWFDHYESNWGVVGVRPNAINDDWGLSLFNDTDFSQLIKNSHHYTGTVNLIAIDGNHAVSGERGLRVAHYENETTSEMARVEMEGSPDENLTIGLNPEETWPARDVCEIWDVYLTPGIYSIELEILSGNANLDLGIFGSIPGSYYKNIGEMLTSSTNHGPGQDESITVTITQADYYGVCVWALNESSADFQINIIAPGTWQGTVDNAWANPDNWIDGIVPDENTDVLIPAGVANYPVISNSEYNQCNNLTIAENASVEIGNRTLNVNGSASIYGTVDISSSADTARLIIEGHAHWYGTSHLTDSAAGEIQIFGNWIADEGAQIVLDQCNVYFYGGESTILRIDAAEHCFNNFIIQKNVNREVVFIEDSDMDLEILGNFVIHEGSEFRVLTEVPVTIHNALICDGKIYFEVGLLYFVGPGTCSLRSSLDSQFCEIIIGGDCVLSILNNINLITISIDGAFNAQSHTIEVAGGWFNNEGTFIGGGSTVIFNGEYNQYVDEIDFDNVIIDKANGGELIISGNAEFVCESLTFDSGTVRVNGGSFTAEDLADSNVKGSYILASGTIDLHQGTSVFEWVNLDANIEIHDGTFNIYGGYPPYSCNWAYNRGITVNISGGILDFKDNRVSINDTEHEVTETITGGTIRTSSDFRVNVDGFNPSGGEIELYGEGSAYLHNNPGSSFHDIRINKASNSREDEERDRLNEVIIDYDTTIDGDLIVENGILQIDEISLTISDDLLFYGGLNMDSEDDIINVADDVTWFNGSGAAVHDGEFHVGGNWKFYNGIDCEFEPDNVVYFDGNSPAYIYSYSTEACFGDVKIDKPNGSQVSIHTYNNNTVQISGDLEVLSDNTFDVFGNELTVDGMIDLYTDSALTIDTGGELNVSNLVMQGNLYMYAGTVTVIDNFHQYSSGHMAIWEGDLILDMPYEGSHESINGYLVIYEGNLQVTFNGIQFGEDADFSQNGGLLKIGWGMRALYPDTFHQNGGTVEFIGSRNSQINLAEGNFFNNVVINKSGTTGQCYMQTDVEVNVDLSILDGNLSTGDFDLDLYGSVYIGEEGKLTGGYNNIKVGGDWTNERGIDGFNEATSTVWFDGDMPAVIQSDETFYHLVVFKQTVDNYYLEVAEGKSIHAIGDLHIIDGTMMLHTDCSLDVDGDILISEGAGLNCYFLDENITINLGGDFSDINTEVSFMAGFNCGEAVFTFVGESHQVVQSYCEFFDFADVVINKSSYYVTFNSNINVKGDLEVLNGRWNNGNSGLTHYIYGNMFLCEDGWGDNETTVIFYGETEASYEEFGEGVSFHNVIIDKDPGGDRNSSRENNALTLGSGLYLLQGGDLTVESGTLITADNTIWCTGDVTINGGTLYMEAGSDLSLCDNNALDVNAGGALRCMGTEENNVRIYSWPYEDFHEVNINSGGLIAAEYTNFRHMLGNGVYVTYSGIVDEDHAFNHCRFSDSIENGSLLKIRNDQELTCYDAEFPTNTWDGHYNVHRSDDRGNLEFINASGDFSGESFDYDPHNRVDWTIVTPPEITVYADDPMDYGEVIVGEMGSIGIDIANAGTMDLTGTITTPAGYTVSFWARDGEEQVNRNALAFTVEGGSLHSYRVDFEPVEVMTYTGEIVIEHNADSDTEIVNVTGVGIPVPPPACEVATEPLELGDVFIGESDSTWINIYNSGWSALVGTMTTPDGYNIEEVVWRDPEGSGLSQQHETVMRNVLDFEVPAGWMMDFKLTFSPTEMQDYNGTLVIEHNAPEGLTQIPVTGRGVETILTFNPYVMTTVLIPDSNEDLILELSNEGNKDINYVAVVEYEGVNNAIIEEGFEELVPPIGWATYTSGWENWYQSDWQPHSGEYCAAVTNMEEEVRLSTPWFNATEDCVLRYWLKGYYDEWDEWMTGNFYVEVSVLGSSWTVLTEMSQEYLPENWTAYGIMLGDYAGETISVSFHLTENMMGRGAMLDDVKITGEANPTYSWLKLNGESVINGTITSNDPLEDITVSFNSTNLTENDYYASIMILNNSRNNPQLEIAAGLNVGVYEMTVTPTSLEYGEVEAGESVTQSFTIENTGSLELGGEITVPEGFIISEYMPGRTNSIEYVLSPNSDIAYELTFAPETYGDFSGEVVISNIWTDDIEYLTLSGTGLAPGIEIMEDMLFIEQQPGNSTTGTLTLANTGNDILEYSAEIGYMRNNRDILVSTGFENEFPPMGWTTQNDGMGDWWQDMMNPHTGTYAAAADPYMLVDARVITPQFAATPDCQLSYYIRTYNQPDAGGSFGVEVSLDGMNWTFLEEIDMSTLSVNYQQRTLSLADYAGLNIQVAFRMYDNFDYYCAGLLLDDVEISGNPVALDEWLTLDGEESISGSIDPGSSTDIIVGYDAGELPEGYYMADIIIDSNDPMMPQNWLMAEMIVGYPHISVNPDSLDFWDTAIGEETWQSFNIENMGDLTLTGEISVPEGFAVLLDSLNWFRDTGSGRNRSTYPFEIDSWMNLNYYVIFTPEIAQSYDGELVITHNAPEAEIHMPLTAQGYGIPEVTTSEITEITEYSASGGGVVLHDGNNTVNMRGICWNETGNPVLDMDMFTVDGEGLGEFTSEMQTLMPGTTYYVRAYAANYYGCGYGEQVTFMTAGPLMIVSVESLPDFGDVGIGSCSSEVSYTVSGTNLIDDIMIFAPNGFQVAAGDSRELSFNDILNLEQIDGIVLETTIYVRFCPLEIIAYNDHITNYTMNAQGRLIMVEGTGVLPPSLNISAAVLPDFGEIPIDTFSAAGSYTVSGIDMLGELVITAPEGFEISLTPDRGLLSRTGIRNSRTFTNELILMPENGMLDETMIYVRFHPEEFGLYNGNIIHQPYYGEPGFVQVTGSGISMAEVQTSFITNISYNSATGGGEVISDGGLDVTARGICWSTEPEPTLNHEFTIDGAGTGSFVSQLTDLMQSTQYYVRAYATNPIGTAYGNQVSLNTLSEPEISLPESFTFTEDGSLEIDFDDYVHDQDYDQLTISVSGNENIFVDINELMVIFSSTVNWNGSETLTFTVSDNVSRATASDDVEIIVTPVNDAPTIDLPESFTFAEDGVLEVDFVNYAGDVDNGELVLYVTGQDQISVDIAELMVTFTSADNWFGSEILTFTVDDQQGRAIASDEVEIIVSSVNDVPIADAGEEYTGQADAGGYCDITLNGTGSYDIDGEIVEWLWTWEGGSADGEEVLAEFPAGTTVVTLTVTDNESGSGTATAQIIIGSYDNLPPVAVTDEFTFNEDSLLAENVLANDYDPDEYPQPLIAEQVSGVTNGALDLAENGDFTYLPDLNWNGTDSFSYRIYDGAAYSEPVIVTFTVTPVNDAPTIELPDSFTFAEDGLLEVDFVDYVDDVDNMDLVLTVTEGSNIIAEINGLIVTFTAPQNWVGSEVTTFTIDDQQSRITASDDVEIIITSVNDLPVADAGEGYTGQADVTGFCEIMLNASGSYDIDGLIMFWEWSWDSGSGSGETLLELFPTGETVVELTVTDNEGGIGMETANVTVTEYGNMPPIASPDQFEGDEDTDIMGNVLENDLDPDVYPEALTVQLITNVTFGVLDLMADGSFNYVPPENWNGFEEFIYRAYDGMSFSPSMFVILDVIPVNDSPVMLMQPDDVYLLEDFEPYTLNLEVYYEDIEEDELFFYLEYNAEEINIIEQSSGIFEIVSIADRYGESEIWIEVTDGDYWLLAYLTVYVEPVNDTPTINLPGNFTFAENQMLNVDFEDYVNDVDGDDLNLIVTGEDHIDAVIDGLLVTFTAEAGWSGSELLSFTIDDSQSRLTASDEVEIIVSSVNDAPVPVTGGPYEGVIYVGDTGEVVLDGSGSYDLDGIIVEWLWSWENTTVSGEVVSGDFYQGTTEITLKVTDNEGAFQEDYTTVFMSNYDNEVPVAVEDTYYLLEDGEIFENVMDNDYDIDELPLPLLAELMEGVSHGVLEFQENGDFHYIPDPDYDEWDSFSYRVFDGADYSAPVNAELFMSSVNDPPTIELPESFSFAEDGILEVDFSQYIDDDEFPQVNLVWSVSSNIFITNNEFLITFSAQENWTGSENIIFTVDDMEGRATASDTVEVIVTPQNDAPVPVAGGPYEGVIYVGDTGEVVLDGSGSYDLDGEIVEWVWSWENTTVSGEIVSGDFYQGITEITLQVIDNEGAFQEDYTTVFMSNYDNEVPVAVEDSYYLLEDGEVSENVMVNDYDVDELPLPLLAELMEGVSHGVLEFQENGDFHYIPEPDWDEWDSFSYRIFDGADYSESVSVDLFMSAVNDPPEIVLPESLTFIENGSLVDDFSQYVNDIDSDLLTLSVTGQQDIMVDINGLTVTFSSALGWTGSEILTFTINDDQERLMDSDDIEIIVTPSDGVSVSKSFIPGWNWFSLNIIGEEMSINEVLASITDNAISIRSQTQSALYYDDLGWFGSLNEINNTSFYNINIENSVTWEYFGTPVDPSEITYNLLTGWNWISYAPQIPEEINYALTELYDNGSDIKSQTQSAIYYYDLGWFGSLTMMQPLDGYMLRADADIEFSYPEPVALSSNNVLTSDSSNQVSAERGFDFHRYEYNGTMIISSEDTIPDNSSISAVCDGEVRSICELLDYTEVFGRKYYSLMIYSNETFEENYQLHYQGSEGSLLIPLDHSFSFQADMSIGDCIAPVIVQLCTGEDDDLPILSDNISLYPNPFNPETTIRLELTDPEKVLVEVYNIKGQKIETLLNTSLPAGEHFIKWNATNQSSGIYFLHYLSDSGNEIRKMILLK
jgi:Big-like domain-containing protein/cadherin-like protein/type IX secretion system substrate protein/centrosomal CEP192-like protein/peptidase C39-like protein